MMLFSRQMYTLLKAGVPIMRALAGLQESTHNPAFTALLQDLRESLDSGRELSAALRRHPKIFSMFYVSMVQVGEMTGMLDETFMRLYSHLEFEKQMSESIRGCRALPDICYRGHGGSHRDHQHVRHSRHSPRCSKASIPNCPLITRLLIGFSNFMVHFWLLLLALLIGAAVGFRFYINTTDGRYKWDKYQIQDPHCGKNHLQGHAGAFRPQPGAGLQERHPHRAGLERGKHGGGQRIHAHPHRADARQCRARRKHFAHRCGGRSIQSDVLQMIAVGEETGDMDGLMFEVAGMYEREVEYEVKTLSAQIEPILIVSLGIMVLILALGIFLPMWDLGKAALHK